MRVRRGGFTVNGIWNADKKYSYRLRTRQWKSSYVIQYGRCRCLCYRFTSTIDSKFAQKKSRNDLPRPYCRPLLFLLLSTCSTIPAYLEYVTDIVSSQAPCGFRTISTYWRTEKVPKRIKGKRLFKKAVSTSSILHIKHGIINYYFLDSGRFSIQLKVFSYTIFAEATMEWKQFIELCFISIDTSSRRSSSLCNVRRHHDEEKKDFWNLLL